MIDEFNEKYYARISRVENVAGGEERARNEPNDTKETEECFMDEGSRTKIFKAAEGVCRS